MIFNWMDEEAKGKGRFAITEEVQQILKRDGFVTIISKHRGTLTMVGWDFITPKIIEGEILVVQDEVEL